MGTVIITGGNTGLGYQCARQLAAAEETWHVVLACRNKVKAEAAAESLIKETGNKHIAVMELDLASLRSVRRFTEAFASGSRPPLKAIVCNAGVQVVSGLSHTEDGFETTFGVNHLGHFLLVNRLLRHLVAPARIVFVSSGTHDPAQATGMPAPRFNDPRLLARPEVMAGASEADPGMAGRVRYSTSKLCNVFCAYELNRRLEAEGMVSPDAPIAVFAFDPGMMPGSGLARDYGPLERLAWHFLLPALRIFMRNVNSLEASGNALAQLVLAPDLQQLSGRYFEGTKAIRSSSESYDIDKARALWDVSADLVDLQASETPFTLPSRNRA